MSHRPGAIRAPYRRRSSAVPGISRLVALSVLDPASRSRAGRWPACTCRQSSLKARAMPLSLARRLIANAFMDTPPEQRIGMQGEQGARKRPKQSRLEVCSRRSQTVVDKDGHPGVGAFVWCVIGRKRQEGARWAPAVVPHANVTARCRICRKWQAWTAKSPGNRGLCLYLVGRGLLNCIINCMISIGFSRLKVTRHTCRHTWRQLLANAESRFFAS